MPWDGLHCVMLLFPDQYDILFEAMTMEIIDCIALFGMYCMCLTNVHGSNRNETCNINTTTIYLCCKRQGP